MTYLAYIFCKKRKKQIVHCNYLPQHLQLEEHLQEDLQEVQVAHEEQEQGLAWYIEIKLKNGDEGFAVMSKVLIYLKMEPMLI